MKRKIITGLGHFHFVTFSTYGRRKLLDAQLPKQIVISVLDEMVRRGIVKVSGFVIMPDHVHAVLWADDDKTIPQTIGSWKSTSAKNLKKYYEEFNPSIIGHLVAERSGRERVCFWQRKYYSFNLESENKLLEKLNYMHYNPVKANLCGRPEDWNWSSAGWYLKKKSVGIRIDAGI